MRTRLVAGVALSVVVLATCATSGQRSEGPSDAVVESSVPTASTIPMAAASVPVTIAVLGAELFGGAYFEAWNAGDIDRWMSFFDPGGSWHGQPLQWEGTSDYVEFVQALGLRYLSAECRSDGAERIQCLTTVRNEFSGAAGLECEVIDVFELNDQGFIQSVATGECPGHLTFQERFFAWLEDTHLEEMQELFSGRLSADAARGLLSRVDDFLEQSPDYPLEPGMLFPKPKLAGVVVIDSDRGVEVYNASSDQVELVAWAVVRFAQTGLVFPDISEIVFPPTAACEGGLSGLASHRESGSIIDVCATAEQVCPEGARTCATLARAARRTILHELAHLWNADHVSELRSEEFLSERGLDAWAGNEVAWEQRGTEQAAEILMWGLMDEAVPMLRLEHDTCDELIVAYRILTGRTPTARVNDCSDEPWRFGSSD